MNLQGDFDGLFLANILQLLCEDKKNGYLHVTSNDRESKVYFKDGTIVYATGSLKKYRLGAILRRNGVITEEQLNKCLELAKERKEALGKVLVDTECISLEALEKYNTQQVEDILYNMLLWKEGKFEYKDSQFSLEGMVVSQLNPMKLILEASRRIDEMSVLTELISSEKIVFRMSGRVQQEGEIKLNANEWRLLSLIDGNRTVRELVAESGYDDFSVYKILYSIISYGLIEKAEEVPAAIDEKIEEVYQEEETAKEERAKISYSSVITLFSDILHAIQKNVKIELGSGASTLFEECKEELDPPFRRLLGKFHPDYPLNVNTEALLEAMAESRDSEHGLNLLIDGFTQYCTAALRQAAALLGKDATMQIIKDVEKVVDYVEKYEPDSGEKSRIANEVRQTMQKVATELTGGKGKGGLFARFKKN